MKVDGHMPCWTIKKAQIGRSRNPKVNGPNGENRMVFSVWTVRLSPLGPSTLSLFGWSVLVYDRKWAVPKAHGPFKFLFDHKSGRSFLSCEKILTQKYTIELLFVNKYL